MDYVMIGLVSVIAFVVGVAVAWAWIMARSGLDFEVIEAITEAAAVALSAIQRVVSDAEVEAIARWTYGFFKVSSYYTIEEWIAFVMRLLPRVEREATMAANLAIDMTMAAAAQDVEADA